METNKIKGWSYKHSFGRIQFGQDKPYQLAITEDQYFDGESWGYNYWLLNVYYPSDQESKSVVDQLNSQYGLPQLFDSDNSERFLLEMQAKFPEAKITKPMPETIQQ